MSAVARIPPPQATSVLPSRGVARSLASAEQNLIPALERQPWPDGYCRALPMAMTRLEGSGFRWLTPALLAEEVANLRQMIDAGPDKDALDGYALPIVEAKTAPPDRAQTIALVAMMLDAYPHGRPANLSAYADSLVHDLLDLKFSPAVVAMACRSIRRTSKFLPSVAELVEAAETAKRSLSDAIAGANHTAGALEKARSILIKAEAAMRDAAPTTEAAA